MSLVIPESHRQKLAGFVGLEASALESLLEALRGSTPHLSPAALVTEVTRSVAADPKVLEDSIRLVLTWYRLRYQQGLTAQEMAEGLDRAAREAGNEVPIPAIGWDAFRDYIARLLGFDATVGVTAKALLVMTTGSRHFHDARILTDARPIFGAMPDVDPTAFVVIHQLTIDVHEGSDRNEWLVGVTSDDLNSLKVQIERALAKEATLRTVLERTAIPTLAWEKESD